MGLQRGEHQVVRYNEANTLQRSIIPHPLVFLHLAEAIKLILMDLPDKVQQVETSLSVLPVCRGVSDAHLVGVEEGNVALIVSGPEKNREACFTVMLSRRATKQASLCIVITETNL